MDLTSSKAFRLQSAKVLRLMEDDVVLVEKEGVDTRWHGVSAYIGVTLRCQRCEADFTFSAREQKVWREEYGLSIHSHPIHCKTCRARERELAVLRKRLSAVLSIDTLSQADFDELIDVTHTLITMGEKKYLQSEGKLKQKIFRAGKHSSHPHAQETVRALKE